MPSEKTDNGWTIGVTGSNGSGSRSGSSTVGVSLQFSW